MVRSPLAKDELHRLPTKNKEYGKNMGINRIQCDAIFSFPWLAGGLARCTSPADINACTRQSAPSRDRTQKVARKPATARPQAREHPKPSAPPARTSYFVVTLQDSQMTGGIDGGHRKCATSLVMKPPTIVIPRDTFTNIDLHSI